MTFPRLPQHPAERAGRRPRPSGSSWRVMRRANPSSPIRCPPRSRYLRQRMGVTVRETRKLIMSAKAMVSASGMKRLRATPVRKTTGKNTTMVVMVETKMGMATSWAAASTALRPVASQLQVPVDVLELHDRVVDEPPHAQRQPAQGEDVERLAGEVEEHEGGHDGERDGHRDDAGGRPAGQEDQDDQDGEPAAPERLVLQRRDGGPDVGRLVEGDGELHAGRDAAQAGQGLAQLVDHVDGVGARAASGPGSRRPARR